MIVLILAILIGLGIVGFTVYAITKKRTVKCVPSCVKTCGDVQDGCGGKCPKQDCDPSEKCIQGSCCAPDCSNSCGGESDGCGGSCPKVECALPRVCHSGTCCTPNCSGSCGGDPDGCGGVCPQVVCDGQKSCKNGQCVSGCTPYCDPKKSCSPEGDGCGGSCPTTTCDSNVQRCVEGNCCQIDCPPNVCGGDDKCGGTCPDRCSALGSNYSCQNGSCVCQPKCNTGSCLDSCGGICPNAPGANYTCDKNTGKWVCQPTCQGKCGTDGCGGSCPCSGLSYMHFGHGITLSGEKTAKVKSQQDCMNFAKQNDLRYWTFDTQNGSCFCYNANTHPNCSLETTGVFSGDLQGQFPPESLPLCGNLCQVSESGGMADGQFLQTSCVSVRDMVASAVVACQTKGENDNCSISVPGCQGSSPSSYQGTCGTDKSGVRWCMPYGPICQTNVFRPSIGTLIDPRDNYLESQSI